MYEFSLVLMFFSITTAEKVPALSFIFALIALILVLIKKDLTNK